MNHPQRSHLAPPHRANLLPTTRAHTLCAVIPTYNNRRAVVDVVRKVSTWLPDIIVVDDGGERESAEIVDELERDGLAIAVHRPINGGKGAAVKTGLAEAERRGFTHALQVDGDGQHDLSQVPAFIDASKRHPEAAVVAWPTYGPKAPQSRIRARALTRFMVNIETGGRVIEDAMVGFRVYPIAPTLACGAAGDHMEFDIEVVVRLAWRGVAFVNLPVSVRYLTEADGGVSHFRMVRDNALITWLHTRLTTWAILRWLVWPLRRWLW